MFFIVIFLLLTALYTYLYSLIDLGIYYIILWIFLAIISSILSIAIYALFFLLVGSKTKPTNRYKHFILRNVCFLAIKFQRIKIVIKGKENILDEPFVVYANHKSKMDPLLIYYSMNRVCSAIGKKSLFVNPLMKLVSKTYGAIPLDRENDREAAKSIIMGIKSVKKGLSMIIFPEGGIKTRDTDEMVSLRAGAYKLATKAEVAVLPVSIIGSSKIATKKFFHKITVELIFHKPIFKEEYKQLNTTQLGLMVENIINEGIASENSK